MQRGGGISFLGRPLPQAFELLVITVAPGRDRPFEPAEWQDAVAVVERGAIELHDAREERLSLARGAVLSLAGMHLRVLRNPGTEPAVVTVVRRRRAARRRGSRSAGGAG